MKVGDKYVVSHAKRWAIRLSSQLPHIDMALERTPVEIWHQIIREATRVPSWMLDGTLYDPIKPKGPLKQIHPKQTYPLFLQLLSIKTSISLVCRCWRHLCSEFLYEFLLIHREDTIPYLVNKFQTLDMNIHKVFRIDFFPLRSSERERRRLSSASTLISLCPSLLAVAFYGSISDADWEHPVFGALAHSRSLRCFEWHTYKKLPEAILLSLRTWSVFIDYTSARYEPCSFERSSEPNSFGRMYNNNNLSSSSNQLSQLNRHMILGSCIDMDLLRDPNEAIHSMNIITLDPYMLRSSSDFLSSLPPTVHTLLIYVKDIPALLSSIAYHVKRIGLKGKLTPSSAEFDHYFNILVGNNTSHLYFPSLRILQLDDLELATALRIRPHQLRLWEHRCSSRGILLRDESGNRFGGTACYPGPHKSKVRKPSIPTLTNKRY